MNYYEKIGQGLLLCAYCSLTSNLIAETELSKAGIAPASTIVEIAHSEVDDQPVAMINPKSLLFGEGTGVIEPDEQKVPWDDNCCTEPFFYDCDVESPSVAMDEEESITPSEIPSKHWYRIDHFDFEYAEPHPHAPDISCILSSDFELSKTIGGYSAPNEHTTSSFIRLDSLTSGEFFDTSAIVAISTKVVERFNDLHLMGVLISVSQSHIGADGTDLRPEGDHSLKFFIQLAKVTEVNTHAVGGRFCDHESLNNPCQKRIVNCSPLQPWNDSCHKGTNLLNRRKLENYLQRLNRYPGRQVAVKFSGTDDHSGTRLDYLVEEQPYSLNIHAANIGTSQTSKWIESVSATHYHLTGGDDILSVGYSTASFDNFHSVSCYYEAPLFCLCCTRWNATTAWSKFTASEFGLFEDEFTGTTVHARLGLSTLIYQNNALLIDLITGIGWRKVSVDNKLSGVETTVDFVIPRLGLSFRRVGDTCKFIGQIYAEGNCSEIAGNNVAEMEPLGRLNPATDFAIAKGNLFISKRIFGQDCDQLSPHQITTQIEGQYSFKSRLTPQFEKILGGQSSVRGYPQSVVSGSSVIMARNDYLYNLPCLTEAFRANLQAFIDFGQSWIHNPVNTERNYTLSGAGVGANFFLCRKLKISASWGIALKSLPTLNVARGDSEIHLSTTITY